MLQNGTNRSLEGIITVADYPQVPKWPKPRADELQRVPRSSTTIAVRKQKFAREKLTTGPLMLNLL